MYLATVYRALWHFVTPADPGGDSELLEFFAGLDQRRQKDLAGMLAKIEHAATDLRGPACFNDDICHKIEDEIWQLSHGALRLLFFYSGDRVVVCAQGFIKKTQKTPKGMKEAAKAVASAFRKAAAQKELVFLSEQE